MAQVNNYIIEDGDGLTVLNDLTATFQAVRDDNAGATAPSNPVPGMRWRDTSVSPPILRIRNVANSGWETFLTATGLTGVTGIATQTQAREGTDNTVLMTSLRVEERVSRFAASGGTTADLDGGFSNRLSVTFTATTKTCFIVANLGVNHGSSSATDIIAELRLFDSVANSEIIVIEGGETATGSWSYAVRIGISMTAANLVIGRSYTARLYLRKNAPEGPTFPRDMRIEGICL